MKHFKKTNGENHEKEIKDSNSWKLYDLEFKSKAKDKKERKSVSNNKIISPSFLSNRLGKFKENFSSEKNNSFNALGKAGSNIITNSKIPMNPKTSNKINQENNNIKSIFNKSNNFTVKNNINYNFKEIKNVINYENVENVNKIQNNYITSNKMEKSSEENKYNFQLSIDNDSILANLNLIEIWIDTDVAIDNKALFSTVINKYLKEFSPELFLMNIEIFNLANINRLYIKVIKLSLIIIVMSKFVLTEFQSYEPSVKFQLKKIFLTISELYAIIYELFVLDLLKAEISDKKLSLVEKLRKLIKVSFANLINNKMKNLSNINEILFQISKYIDNNLLNQIRNFSSSYFNYGFLQPIFNVITELLKQTDKISLQKLITIITECILYNFIKKEVIFRITKGSPGKLNQIDNSMNPYYLPQVQVPFLPPLNENIKQYTLVLDLDETLVHFFYTLSGGTFFIRPHMFEFLLTLSQMYEIVIFTASMKEYADNIINLIDPLGNLISHRLYRQHTTISEIGVSKDLTKLGRNLNKTIIVDNLPENFRAQPNNGLGIKTWTDDMNDNELQELQRILKDIYMLKIDDIKLIIKKINEIIIKASNVNSFSIYKEIDIMKF